MRSTRWGGENRNIYNIQRVDACILRAILGATSHWTGIPSLLPESRSLATHCNVAAVLLAVVVQRQSAGGTGRIGFGTNLTYLSDNSDNRPTD